MKNIELFVLETLVFMLNVLVSKSELCSLDKDFQRSYVGLTLSPIYRDHNYREINIIWRNENFKKGDQIVLFAYSKSGKFRSLYEITPKTPHGMDGTGIEADLNEPKEPLFIEQCRKYYVAWIRNGYIRDINCLGNQPTWMFNLYDFLKFETLRNLFIPGTRDSGTYNYRQTVVWGSNREPIFNPSAQDLDVMTQLVLGVRYIHVHVGYHQENPETVWWVHKMNDPMTKLDIIIDQVKMFLSYTREIVVFDVQGFSLGFETKQTYIDLMNYTRTRFGTFLPPAEYNLDTPLNQIWNWSRSALAPKMGRVLLNFNFNDAPDDFPELKHSFIEYNSIESHNFQDYFERLSKIEVQKENMTGNAVLRATLVGFKPSNETSARDLAERINPDITIWYHEFWYLLANIVALDFIETGGLVDVAIKSNKFRYKYRMWTANCVSPSPQALWSAEYMMSHPQAVKLLAPRIVENAVEKIYDLLLGLGTPVPAESDSDY